MTREELAGTIYNISNIRGDFVLRSGQRSTEYFDKYLFEGRPDVLSEIAGLMKEMIPANIEYLAGLEMGGIPIATALSLITGMPTLFVRKKAKQYGTCKLAEGGDVENRRLLIVEDVVTFGGAIIDAVRELRGLGAIVEDVICVIDREGTGRSNLQAEELKFESLFTKSFLEKTTSS
jgi:orotate phosphoribosyltransferase